MDSASGTLRMAVAAVQARQARVQRGLKQHFENARDWLREQPAPAFRHLLFWIIVAVAIPTTAWFLTAAWIAHDRYQTVRSMNYTGQLADFALAGNRLIHALQLERSLSAAHLVEGDPFFSVRLAEARQETSRHMRQVQHQMLNLPAAPLTRQLDNCMQEVRGVEERLQSLRHNINLGHLTVMEGVDGLSIVIEDIHACLSVVEQASNESAITQRLRTLRAFAAYKDFADLERSYGTALLAAGIPDPGVYRQFLHHAELQAPYARRILTEQDSGLEKALGYVHDSEVEQRLHDLRTVMTQAIDGRSDANRNALPVPEVWFAVASDRLEALHQAERMLMDKLSSTVAGIDASARQDLQRVLAAFGVTALAVPLLSLGIAAGVGRRIRLERRQNRNIRFLATRDFLTGLYNRRRFDEVARRVIAKARRYDRKAALLIIDLHRFTDINHIWGEAVGDAVLRETASRLKVVAGRHALIARTYGDEFSILLPDCNDHVEAEVQARQIMAVFSAPFDLEHRSINIQASGGGAVFPDDGSDQEEMMVAARLARDVAKESSSDSFHFFSAGMYERFEYQVVIEEGLKQALSNKEFEVYYQPRLRLPDQKLVAVEALVRWNHPALGQVNPEDFVPVAEANGSIVRIGRWVLEEACRRAVDWQRDGLPDLRVSVNLSAVQFHQSDIIADVTRALEKSGLPADRLELELTETAVMADIDQSAEILLKLRELGVMLSIDDFGTGYSSLSYLQRFPVQQLKLDKSFVHGLPQDADAVAIARTIINLSQGLNREVVAEGVENAEQAQFLSEAGCKEGQGYYFSKPLTARELSAFASEKSNLPAESGSGY
ncbi:putative bifunctional diguanylate cyclase/phosphodiesterase [Natronospira bacteriovora]|uniref:EAL domain-containing protein n=1 Tax=Natronospira bacteriovora TaxID=3069753 RepID=A0ABU0W4S7_9GAMM|nr:EAL domain-containing protein [Natronospira sp. AB-CW4]MDQ2068972.1 EAL domain-containing protein [Natronospira sp. AB-CW4]